MADLTTRAGKGSELNFVELDENFQEIARRTDQGWDDLVSPMTIQTGAPDAPTLTEWIDGFYLPEFNHTNDLCVLGQFHINHRYKLGTMMYPHLHFSISGADTAGGVVRLGFRYKLARRHDSTGQTTFTAPVELALNFTIPAGGAITHFVAEIPDGQGIPGTHIEPDMMILMQSFRRATHPNDTFAGSIWAMTHDIHYECDVASTPNRSPDFYA